MLINKTTLFRFLNKKTSKKLCCDGFVSFYSAFVFAAKAIRKFCEKKAKNYLEDLPDRLFLVFLVLLESLSASNLILVASSPKRRSILLLFFAF